MNNNRYHCWFAIHCTSSKSRNMGGFSLDRYLQSGLLTVLTDKDKRPNFHYNEPT